MMGALGRTFGEIKGTKNDTEGCWKGIFFPQMIRGAIGDNKVHWEGYSKH
jgi:hypothetical protein